MLRSFVGFISRILAGVRGAVRRLLKTGGGRRTDIAEICNLRQALRSPSLQELRGRPGIWKTEAESFGDAYRFMLRICCRARITPVRRACLACYEMVLPGGGGTMLLTGSTGNRRGAVAVMVFHIAGLPDLKELRFVARTRPD